MGQDRAVAALVEFADTLVQGYEVTAFLQRLCDRSLELFAVSSAGVTLIDARGAMRMAAGSDATVEHLEQLQAATGDGPCVEAVHAGAQVLEPDLKGNGPRRWPRFTASLAPPHEAAAVFAFPMRLRDRRVGALNMFSDRVGPLPADDLVVAQALADVATIGILQERAVDDAHVVAAQLQHALDSRVLIEQAKGMIAQLQGVDPDTAFQRMRRYGRHNGLRLRDLARDVVDGALQLPAP